MRRHAAQSIFTILAPRMFRSALLAAGAILLAPAAATAAPFGVTPFVPVEPTATCLRATGVPGELIRATATGSQILHASAAGIVPAEDVVTGNSFGYACPRVAA